jgi:beta-lactamase class C
VLDIPLLQNMQTARVKTPQDLYSAPWRRARLSNAEYGLGVRIYHYGNERVVFHGGAVQGFRAFFVLIPRLDVGFAALWNSDSLRTFGMIPVIMDQLTGNAAVDWMELDKLIPNQAYRDYMQRRLDRMNVKAKATPAAQSTQGGK